MQIANFKSELAAPVTGHSSPVAHAALIAAVSLVLIAGCWDAGFLLYDDSDHVKQMSFVEIFRFSSYSTYFPVVQLTYELDALLFSGWMPRFFVDWAPGARAMTLLYHVLASLLLWRVLLRLQLSAREALFGAMVFACHPLACETVCWVSERKNALAALFSFGLVLLWGSAGGGRWRIPAAAGLFLLALLSKPSALGFLPLLAALELGGNWRGIAGMEPLPLRNGRAWASAALRLLPLALIAAVILYINLEGHKGWIVKPPGGSIYTALLTDLEILCRYLGNLAAPFLLSAIYFVEPILSLGDPRVWQYGLLLLALFAATLWLARNRRRALFGWIWFFAALGANLNLIALSHFMQDRYIYLSTPGFLLVLIETGAGIAARLPAAARALPVAAAAYVALLAGLALPRSAAWSSSLALFSDAAAKQPRASYAHFGAGSAWGLVWQQRKADPRRPPAEVEAARKKWLEHWTLGAACTDATRYSSYMTMSLHAGEFSLRDRGDPVAAEKFFKQAAYPPPEMWEDRRVTSQALAWLSVLRRQQGRPGEAYALANDSLKLESEPANRMVRAEAAIALAADPNSPIDRDERLRLIAEAKQDAESVPRDSELFEAAQRLLKN